MRYRNLWGISYVIMPIILSLAAAWIQDDAGLIIGMSMLIFWAVLSTTRIVLYGSRKYLLYLSALTSVLLVASFIAAALCDIIDAGLCGIGPIMFILILAESLYISIFLVAIIFGKRLRTMQMIDTKTNVTKRVDGEVSVRAFSGTAIYLVLLLGLSGCGYFSSGTWENDPDNWGRAFQSTKPDDVVVLHSKYWRSPHWTYEFEYFFEIERNDALQKQLFTQNKLVRLEGQDAIKAKDNFFGESPAWFAPKTADQYEVWVYEEAESHFRVFADKETGNLFLTDYQV